MKQRGAPNVICPYCNETYTTSDLIGEDDAAMNLSGGLFPCPECNQPVKIDPFELMFVKKGLEDGSLRNDTVMGAYKANEPTIAQQKMRKKKGFWVRIRAFFGNH